MENFKLPCSEELFDLLHTDAAELISGGEYPFSCIPDISRFALTLGKRLVKTVGYREIYDGVFASPDAKISDRASIAGPTVIGGGTEVRPFAFIRGGAIIGCDAVIGNSTEIKNSIIFDEAQLPHYNYVGDSIIGHRAHLGAGATVSNFRLDHGSVTIKKNGKKLDTGMRKMGALIGDFAEIGSGSVISPGSIVGRRCVIMPLSSFAGILDEKEIYKGRR